MVPKALLNYKIADKALIPIFLDAADVPWVRLLVAEYQRFEQQPQHLLHSRLKEPMPFAYNRRKLALVCHVLNSLWQARVRAALPPREARAMVFAEASRSPAPKAAVLASVAANLNIEAKSLREALFADVPDERTVIGPDQTPTPAEIVLRGNLALAQGLLCRSLEVGIQLEGNARAVVRHAKLRGLICTVARGNHDAASLDISGPLSLFHRTTMYGRALAELVPILSWCNRFTLRAPLEIAGVAAVLTLTSGDPIFPSPAPRLYDSRVEERFARDFLRVAKDWDLVREPEPITAGNTLIFPDFALQHRLQPNRRYFLEIAGFWTRDYIEKKLTRLRAAGLNNIILCIDADRDCAPGELPESAHIIRYRRRVDATAVLRLIEPDPAMPCPTKMSER